MSSIRHERASERGGGEVLRVRGDDALGAAPDRRREHVPVVLVGQGQAAYEFFPAGDQGVVEGLAHLREVLAGVDGRVDLLGGRLRLGEDPVGPQRPAGALLGHAQRPWITVRPGDCAPYPGCRYRLRLLSDVSFPSSEA